MIRCLLLLLLLAACSNQSDVLAITPRLSCPTMVRCHAIAWQIGLRFGPMIAGTHVVCRCAEE